MSHDEDQVREVMVAVDAAHGAAVRRGVLWLPSRVGATLYGWLHGCLLRACAALHVHMQAAAGRRRHLEIYSSV